jgi:hypothetical protein
MRGALTIFEGIAVSPALSSSLTRGGNSRPTTLTFSRISLSNGGTLTTNSSVARTLLQVSLVVPTSVDEGCVDENGYVVWEKLKPAHYCGNAYKNGFVAAYERMEVDMIYKEPIGPRNVGS